ncbi:MAG TPA: type II toxin-antitoxin system HicB family antitoxin [Ktedonobacteraceae bacterium]|nr:type II toxin-antitoxin system HicB family antitoxin [Ktedonobacteraceae bacterium]
MSKRFDHYSMYIQWDNVDRIYIVSVSELPGCKTHGDTLEEAIKNAQEVIELWIEASEKGGQPIPAPRVLRAEAA